MHKLRSYIIACAAHKFHLTQSQCLTSRNPTAFRCKWMTNIKVESSSSTEVSVGLAYGSTSRIYKHSWCSVWYDIHHKTRCATLLYAFSRRKRDELQSEMCDMTGRFSQRSVVVQIHSCRNGTEAGTLGWCGYKHDAVSVWEFSIWSSSGYQRSHAVLT